MFVNYLALWQVGCNAVVGDILVLGHQEDVKQNEAELQGAFVSKSEREMTEQRGFSVE